MTVIATKLPEKFYNYVQDTSPSNPEVGETWLDTSTTPQTAKVYEGNSNWVDISITNHGQLSGINSSDHHTYPIDTAGIVDGGITDAKLSYPISPLVKHLTINDSSDSAKWRLNNGNYDLHLQKNDGSGNYVDFARFTDSGELQLDELGTKAATQAELNNHAGDANAHHSRPSLSQEALSDVSGSRSLATWYQNTTGEPLVVSVVLSSDGSGWAICRVYMSSDKTKTKVVENTGPSGSLSSATFVVPENQYYYVDNTNGMSITTWREGNITLS